MFDSWENFQFSKFILEVSRYNSYLISEFYITIVDHSENGKKEILGGAHSAEYLKFKHNCCTNFIISPVYNQPAQHIPGTVSDKKKTKFCMKSTATVWW